MKAKEVVRLKELLSKAPKDRTEIETKEVASLQKLAEANGYNPETAEPVEDEGLMTQDEARKMISEESAKAVTSVLNEIGLDAKLVEGISTKLAGEENLTAEGVKDIVSEAGADINPEALTKQVEKALENHKGVSPEDLKAALEDFGKEQAKKFAESRVEFPTDAAYPVEHRGGNLTVGQKQLLNLCLQHVSDEALSNSDGGRGIKRPQSINDGITEAQLTQAKRAGHNRIKSIRDAVTYGQKAIVTGTATSGAELIPTDLSSDLMSRLYLASDLATELIASEIEMPTSPFELPLRTTRTTFYTGSENPGSDPTASNPGTGKVTLTAQKLIGRALYSYEADEDAIISILPFLQEDMGEGAADAFEGALLNGDTTGTHMDSDIEAVTDHGSKLFKGLRFYAKDNSLACATDISSGGISTANIQTLRKNMARWGVKPRDVLIVCGVKGYSDLVGLAETLTADKVGNNVARILTGEAAQFMGMKIIVSSQCREDLNATAVYDGTTTDNGSILLVHRPSWHVGTRKGFTVEVDRNISKQTNEVVASFRRDFQPKETPTAAIPIVWMGYNYTA